MRLQSAHVLLLLLSVGCTATAQQTTRAAPQRPGLVVMLTIDQLRPDYLDLYRSQLTGGLGRLLKAGAFYPNGFQDHGNTETAPGHASILSGRFPRSTGIVANAEGVLDHSAPLVDAAGEGASPYRFRGTVLYDWMRLHDARSRALSVSRKDRGAILPLGRAKGEAYWYALNGLFTTSRYYADTLPSWVKAFNARRLPQRLAGTFWTLLLDSTAYAEADIVEVEAQGEDVMFPHPLPADSAGTVALLPNYPMMDELTLQFALAGMQAREIGATPGRMDLLAISLSTTDAVGHRWGPDSRELHDQILRLDRYLGTFLDSLYSLRDSSAVLIALTADHGVAPFPVGVTSRYRSEATGAVNFLPYVRAFRRSLIAAGVDSTAMRWDLETLYLEPDAFTRAGVNRDSVARAFASGAAQIEGVRSSELYSEVAKRNPETDVYARRWQHMFPPDVPVAVITTLKPFWYWTSGAVATHGSPHDYDARVPVLFSGFGIRPGRHDEMVRVVDIAPTLAALMRVRPLETLDGVVLKNAVR